MVRLNRSTILMLHLRLSTLRGYAAGQRLGAPINKNCLSAQMSHVNKNY
jgi:hypothetical protein